LAGKPICERYHSNNQLQAMLNVKKGGLLHHWQHRLCVLSNTRLLLYKGTTFTAAGAAATVTTIFCFVFN